MINLNNSCILERHISSYLNKDKKGYSVQSVQKGVRKAKTKYCCMARRLAVGSLYNTGPIPKISLRKMWIRQVLLKQWQQKWLSSNLNLFLEATFKIIRIYFKTEDGGKIYFQTFRNIYQALRRHVTGYDVPKIQSHKNRKYYLEHLVLMFGATWCVDACL
jgi:hypothetical protein